MIHIVQSAVTVRSLFPPEGRYQRAKVCASECVESTVDSTRDGPAWLAPPPDVAAFPRPIGEGCTPHGRTA